MLPEHLDKWVSHLDEFCTELYSCPNVLRTKVLAIIPEEIETILTDDSHPEVKTWLDIIAFCKKRAYNFRQKSIAKQRVSQGSSIRTLQQPSSEAPAQEQPPAWAQTFINAVTQGRKPSDRPRSVSPSQRPRSPSPSGFKPKGRFIFKGGCNHCNSKEHQRQACTEFLALKAKHGGELPPNYKGAREVAYEKWRNNQKKAADAKTAKKGPGSQRALSGVQPPAKEDTEDEDESDFSESDLPDMANGRPHICAALVDAQAQAAWSPVVNGTKFIRACRPVRQQKDFRDSTSFVKPCPTKASNKVHDVYLFDFSRH